MDEHKMVCKFYQENRCRFADNCRNLHPKSAERVSERPHAPRVSDADDVDSQMTHAPIKPPEEQHVAVNEKCFPGPLSAASHRQRQKRTGRMRTAADVLNRICWDPALKCRERFSVVYLDRFASPIEVPLLQFCGQSDNDVPQHRIQQIVYKNHVVWDKQARADFVFGSTGGYQGTIADFIQQVDQPNRDVIDGTQLEL